MQTFWNIDNNKNGSNQAKKFGIFSSYYIDKKSWIVNIWYAFTYRNACEVLWCDYIDKSSDKRPLNLKDTFKLKISIFAILESKIIFWHYTHWADVRMNYLCTIYPVKCMTKQGPSANFIVSLLIFSSNLNYF